MKLRSQLKDAYELDSRLFALSLRGKELGETVKQAKAELRDARVRQVEYTGFRALWDKAHGRYADKAEALDYRVRRAEAELKLLQRQQSEITEEISDIQTAKSSLPSMEELKAAALESPETARLWAALECRLCAGKLPPLLEKNEQALLEYRRLLRGEYPVLSVEQQQTISAEPDIWAQQCSELLERMQEPLGILGMALEIPPYYQSPIFFLMYAAAKHNRMDRASQALDQVQEVRRLIARIPMQLDAADS